MSDSRFETAYTAGCFAVGTPGQEVAIMSGSDDLLGTGVDVPVGSVYYHNQSGKTFKKFGTNWTDWVDVSLADLVPVMGTTITSPYNITQPMLLRCDTTNVAITVNLPNANTYDKKLIIIKLIAKGGNRAVTVVPNGVQKIDNDLASITIGNLYETVSLMGVPSVGWLRV